MAGKRKALIVANDEYEHDGLKHLRSPGADAEALAGVLGDPEIGGFDVRVVHNEPAHIIQGHIEDLFADGRPDDVLLLHFSCHGLKSESGELFFAARNTLPHRLGSTATSADFVQRCMRASRSRSVVLLLDCCYGGAFSKGVTVRAAGDMNVLSSFAETTATAAGGPGGRVGGGRGRAVITASSAMEYAFEGDQLADDHSRRPSVFTSALVEGLATGDADRDQDGWVSLNELYDYVFDRVREQNPHQTPSRDVEMQGELYVARRSRPVTVAAPLPPELQAVIDNPIAGVRAGAIQELTRLYRGRHAGLSLAAANALQRLVHDDSRSVAAAAEAALAGTETVPEPPAPAGTTPAATTPAGATPVRRPAPPPASRGARRRNRWLLAAGAVAVLAAAATTTALVLGNRGDTGSPAQTFSGTQFTATSPWRLVITDAAQGVDHGCDVTVTGAGRSTPVAAPTQIYSSLTVQVRESGTFGWTANDSDCIVRGQPGAGSVALPFVQTTHGDTDAFTVHGPITVQVLNSYGNHTCELVLHDAGNGRPLAVASAAEGGAPATLDPAGPSQAFLHNDNCDVRIAAE
ncbi:caspase domain-containing protein [Plantactinospora siamensis]|uniref:Caspase domain-containing protein n=1 Tax=Plantactinospora siamensis TaxID=555372 RepID=A0ABV6NYW3_9ACTN